MNKKPINQHKQMASGNLDVGFKKGGKIETKKMGGTCTYKSGGKVKKGKK